MTDLGAWFRERPRWLQDAARRLLLNGEITPADLDELIWLCKSEVSGTPSTPGGPTAQVIPAGTFGSTSQPTPLFLDEMAEISGVNALAPRNPLKFGPEPLTIVFGSNGSGKSGYLRLLKHICGAKAKGSLHGNVFDATPVEKRCTIRFTVNGSRKEVSWTPASGVVEDLRGVAIYDTECAHVYIDDEHEVTYEPPILATLRQLVDVSTEIERRIASEIETKVSVKPDTPVEHAATENGKWYGNLNRDATQADIDLRCAWSAEYESTLTSLGQRLAEPDPEVKARNLRRTKGNLAAFQSLIRLIETQVTDEAYTALRQAKTDAADKRRAADEDAKKVFAGAPLEGVASASWRLLWEQARKYSEGTAFPMKAFPNVETDARCVLCQQLLDIEAKDRLGTFEGFVKGNLEREATQAEIHLEELCGAQMPIPLEADLEQSLDSGGITDESLRQVVRSYIEDLACRREKFPVATELAQLPLMPDSSRLAALTDLEMKLEEQAGVFEEDANADRRGEMQEEIRELNTRKWLCDRKLAIEAEIARLGSVYVLEQARRLTNTTALSTKASALADELVTATFKKRFGDELKALGARKILVEIEKKRAVKGQVWHQIKLTAAKTPIKTTEVLSEGEFRIVSIAAFLADVAVSGVGAPLVFDDPISSLDLDFEEKTAQRLVELSRSRQVIVFTHRLSLLASLEGAARKAGVDSQSVSLMREVWGAGEPSAPPLSAQKPKTALNALQGERLSKAKKVHDQQGSAAYAIEAQALCSDVRKTIERLIENDLLADVVQRFRRSINTMGKMQNLAKIEAGDCALLDEMMTKYSYFEHSQPDEAPVALPEPDELKEDLQKLKDWLDDFTARAVMA